MKRSLKSIFRNSLSAILLLVVSCQSETLPEGTFVRQDATPENFIAVEVKGDTLIWKQELGKLTGKHFIYSISNGQLTGKCIETGERIQRTFQKDSVGFLLGKIPFTPCPDMVTSIADGDYIQYNAYPINTSFIVIKGDSITKTQSRYDQVVHTVSAQYSIDQHKCSIYVKLHNGIEPVLFRPSPDGFILGDARYVKVH